MERVPVGSTSLASVGYDIDTGILEIEFLNGRVYEYHQVPEYAHQELMSAGSHGIYFNANIKNAYSCTRVQ